jgi:hypothetical protein
MASKMADICRQIEGDGTRGDRGGSREVRSAFRGGSATKSSPVSAHDVGRSRDRSAAVIGGNRPVGPRLGIMELEELPKGLY